MSPGDIFNIAHFVDIQIKKPCNILHNFVIYKKWIGNLPLPGRICISPVMKTEKKTVGRPPKPDAQKMKLSQVRITDRDRTILMEAARRCGMSYSEFMREAALEKAGKSA